MAKFSISFVLFLFCSTYVKSQNLMFQSEYYTWPDQNKNFDVIPDSLENDDAIILNDDIDLNFSEHFIKRRQSVKILKQKGLAYYKTITLPQNFDITKVNNPTYKQGRFSKRIIPFIYEYKISYFSARIIRNKTIIDLPLKVSTNKVCWVKSDGERLFDYEYIFDFSDLEVGDIIEYTYKAEIKGSYDTDQFYVNDYFPKLKTHLSIKLTVRENLVWQDIILNNNIDSSLYSLKKIPQNTNTILFYNYTFESLKGIKYSQNCLAGSTLAHITARDVYNLNGYKFNETQKMYSYLIMQKYRWLEMPDSLQNKKRIYDKYGASLRKFISTFPENEIDSTKTIFLSKLTDTINKFTYLSSEQLRFSQEAKYSLNAPERLLKRQFVGSNIWSLYLDILFEKNIFYYIANIQDRRLGFHSNTFRAHNDYELEFIALPIKDFYRYYIPRINGVKYLPDELPFYYEGTNCVLFPKNTQVSSNKKNLQKIKFTKTPISNYNENVRTENAVFTVNLDSSIIHASIKENLSGQFSTILRHYYTNDCIDSTIKFEYFKKCIEKPNSNSYKTSLVSLSKIFPFKASFKCSENIQISKKQLDLTGWFSFLFSKENFQNAITQDYYLDFTFTDTYNFMFEFSKPVNITNMDEFTKTMNNDFFEIKSVINKQENNKYLLTITTKAKQYVIPKEKTNYLIDYIYSLSQLNSLKLEYTN